MRWKKEFQYFSLSVIFANHVHVRPGLTLITPLHATQHTTVYSSAIDSNSCRNGVRTVAACDMAAIATHNRSTYTTHLRWPQMGKDKQTAVTKMRNGNEKCVKKGLCTDVGVARRPICKLASFYFLQAEPVRHNVVAYPRKGSLSPLITHKCISSETRFQCECAI